MLIILVLKQFLAEVNPYVQMPGHETLSQAQLQYNYNLITYILMWPLQINHIGRHLANTNTEWS